MTTGRSHPRPRAIVASCLGAALAAMALAGGAQATEYHQTANDITTNQGRTCGHGLNGAPRGAVSTYLRDIYTENGVSCGYGSSGQPSELYVNLYLDSDYGTEVQADGLHVGYGPSNYVGGSSTIGDYTHVEGSVREYNVPTRYEVYAYDTFRLPTSGTEDFTSYPKSGAYSCSGYYRLHDGLNGWHLSGLSCFGDGIFTAGVAPYLN
jgi:hypothetical protein